MQADDRTLQLIEAIDESSTKKMLILTGSDKLLVSFEEAKRRLGPTVLNRAIRDKSLPYQIRNGRKYISTLHMVRFSLNEKIKNIP